MYTLVSFLIILLPSLVSTFKIYQINTLLPNFDYFLLIVFLAFLFTKPELSSSAITAGILNFRFSN